MLGRMSNRMVAALGCNRGDMVHEARAISHRDLSKCPSAAKTDSYDLLPFGYLT